MEPASLPIFEARAEVEAGLRGRRPLIVAAPTGSGKSTTLPGWASEVLGGPVLIVEPRRVACRALAGWVAQSRGEAVGQSVGYQVRFERRGGPDTRIWFVTPGVALNLLGDEALERAGYVAVIVDEFHERSWEIDLVVALLRSRSERERAPALVLCSATLDLEGLREALDARVVQTEGRSFPVTVHHEGEGGPTDRDLDERTAAAVSRALEDPDGGDVLVFLPGKREIEGARAALVGAGAVRRSGAELVAVHGGLPPDRLARAFAASSGRRVFLSTNVAETSLTLPGVRTVIDGGLARMRLHRGGHSVLAVAPISQASADQRAGRAGRVAAGACVRLWGSAHELRPVTVPEIGRVELDDLVLRAAQCGLHGEALARAPWVEPPPTFALERAQARLRDAGALDRDGRPTPQGRAQMRAPVAAERSRLFVDVPPTLAGDVADLAAVIEVSRELVLAGVADESVEAARRDLFAGSLDEVDVAVRALRAGEVRRQGLHGAALAEARKLSDALRNNLGADRRGVEPLDRAGLSAHLAARLPGAAFARRERADRKARRGGERGTGPSREPWGNGQLEVMVRPYAILGVEAHAQPPPPEAGFVLEQIWLGDGGRSSRGVGRLVFAVPPRRLAQLGLGQLTVAEPRLERGRGRGVKIVGTVERTLGGTVLDARSEPLQGAPLRDSVAAFIVQGRLRKGLGERVANALHLWALAAEAYPIDAPPAGEGGEPRAWLAERLRTLGLEHGAELELLDDDDLVPDPEAAILEATLDPRELEALRRDFPRTWIHEDARYRCTVELARRVVTLEPDNKRARAAQEPPVGKLPRFRGFSIAYQKASRRVQLR